MPTGADKRLIPGQLAVVVFLAVIVLIAIVFAVQLIPDAQRPTLPQSPRATTTTIIIPAPTNR